MEIHTPHGAARNWKDLLIQLGTITAGVLIALSFEGAREAIRDRGLVREARENIRREIEDNKQEIDGALRGFPEQTRHIEDALTFANDMAKARHSAIQRLELGVSNASLSTASWQTADRTGALAHMAYRELKTYANAYAGQELYSTLQQRTFAQISSALAIMSPDPTSAPLADIEQFRRQLLELRGQLYVLEQMAKQLSETYRKTLE